MTPAAMMVLLPTLAKFGVGVGQAIRGSQLGRTPRPEYEIPRELYDVLGSAQREAAQIELPGQSLLEQKLGGTTSRAISAMKEASDSPAAILGAISGLAEGERGKLGDIAITAAQGHRQSQEILRNALREMAGQKQAKWQWETAQPYMEAMDAARRTSEAGLQNIFSGLTGAATGYYEADINKKLMEILGDYTGSSPGGGGDSGMNESSVDFLKMLISSGAGNTTQTGIYPGTEVNIPSNMFTNYDFDTNPYIID